MDKTRILFLSEENETLSFMQDVLASVDEYEAEVCSNRDRAVDQFHRFMPAITVIHIDSQGTVPSSFLNSILKEFPAARFLGFSENPERLSPEWKKLFDQISTPEDLRLHFMAYMRNLRALYRLRSEIQQSLSKIIGHGNAIKKLYRTIEKAIPGNGSVLIQGESGVGKELVAKAIACVQPKFVIVNCSAIPENLFESELFGHIRGAFTGAITDRIGLFEEASGGTLFLDEIGDIPLAMQSKLLRSLQEGEIRPVGSNRTKKVSVRIIAATNRDLKKEIEIGNFRKDLYFRLDVIPIHIPPLRNRKEDLPELVEHFIKMYAMSDTLPEISDETIEKLKEYDWPGNIRELENAIHRAISFMDDNTITIKDIFPEDPPSFNPQIRNNNWATMDYESFREFQKREERDFITEKILENGGSIKRTAESFGILRTALHNKAARIGLDLHTLRKKKNQ